MVGRASCVTRFISRACAGHVRPGVHDSVPTLRCPHKCVAEAQQVDQEGVWARPLIQRPGGVHYGIIAGTVRRHPRCREATTGGLCRSQSLSTTGRNRHPDRGRSSRPAPPRPAPVVGAGWPHVSTSASVRGVMVLTSISCARVRLDVQTVPRGEAEEGPKNTFPVVPPGEVVVQEVLDLAHVKVSEAGNTIR